MKVEIMILNKMCYEKDGVNKSRLGYIYTGEKAFARSEKFCGYSEQALYTDNDKLFFAVPDDWVGKKVQAFVAEEQNPRNPLKPRKTISSLEKDGQTVNLV